MPINPSTTPISVHHMPKCTYCECTDESSLVYCPDCDEFFCNSRFVSDSDQHTPSHIIFHAQEANHRILQPCNDTVCRRLSILDRCEVCGSRDTLTLGICIDLGGDDFHTICHSDKCMTSRPHLWDGTQWIHGVDDRAFRADFISMPPPATTMAQARSLERSRARKSNKVAFRKLAPLRMAYSSAADYATSMATALAVCAQSDINDNADQTQTGCTIVWLDPMDDRHDYDQASKIAWKLRRHDAYLHLRDMQINYNVNAVLRRFFDGTIPDFSTVNEVAAELNCPAAAEVADKFTHDFARRRLAVVTLPKTPQINLKPGNRCLIAIERPNGTTWQSNCTLLATDSYSRTVMVDVLLEDPATNSPDLDIIRVAGMLRQMGLQPVTGASKLDARCTDMLKVPTTVKSDVYMSFGWQGSTYVAELRALKKIMDSDGASLGPLARPIIANSATNTTLSVGEAIGYQGTRIDDFDPATIGLTPGWYGNLTAEKWMTQRAETLRSDPGDGDFARLNASQRTAVLSALSQRLTVIQGPPGTGKSHVASVLIRELISAAKATDAPNTDPTPTVLCLAPSNIAADQLAALLKRAEVNVIRVFAVSREFNAMYTPLPDALACGLHTLAGTDASSNEGREHEIQLLRQCNVIVTTTTNVGQLRISSALANVDPSRLVVVVDEATQSVEPEIAIALQYKPAALVLIGDHKQLGPTIASPQASKAGYGVSMFSRMVALGYPVYQLNIQHRMHPAIAEWPSRYVYRGNIINGVSALDRPCPCPAYPWPAGPAKPIYFHNVEEGMEETGPAGTSCINKEEMRAVNDILHHLMARGGVPASSIGIITPYRAQCDRLAELHPSVEVASVDGFQGREKEIIIISLVRSNTDGSIGFVDNINRINVSVTRARSALIIVGNARKLAKTSKFWRDMIGQLARDGRVVEGNIECYRKSENLPTEDVEAATTRQVPTSSTPPLPVYSQFDTFTTQDIIWGDKNGFGTFWT